jgi:hypothetical protein
VEALLSKDHFRTGRRMWLVCSICARCVGLGACGWQHISHRSTPEPPAPPGQNAGPRRRWQRAIAGRTVDGSRCQNSAIIRRSAGAESMRRRRLSHQSAQRARYLPPALVPPHPEPPQVSGRRKDERRSRTDGGVLACRTDGGMLAYGAVTLRRVGRAEVEKVRGKLVANLEKQAIALNVAPGAPGATHVLCTPGATFRAVARTGTHVLCTCAPGATHVLCTGAPGATCDACALHRCNMRRMCFAPALPVQHSGLLLVSQDSAL